VGKRLAVRRKTRSFAREETIATAGYAVTEIAVFWVAKAVNFSQMN
jgi:hypothetical protein